MSRPLGSRNRRLHEDRRGYVEAVWTVIEEGLRDHGSPRLSEKERWLIASWLASDQGLAEPVVRREDAARALGLSVHLTKRLEERLGERLDAAARVVWRRRRERRDRVRNLSFDDLLIARQEQEQTTA